jgi:hypothetical protein
MSIQRLHAFEKTAVQIRHTVKRLEVFTEVTKIEEERILAEQLLIKFKEIRNMIPEEFKDVDLKEKE